MVEAVAHAIISHVETCVGLHAADHGWFDERKHPLREGALSLSTSLDAIQSWLWAILDGLRLDAECLIISLVLLERCISMSSLRLTPFTWRPCTLCALLCASKSWYDTAIFNVDFSERLPDYNLTHINTIEGKFLKALDYRTGVSMTLYAKYFFALQDVLGTSSTRRSTWSPGEAAP